MRIYKIFLILVFFVLTTIIFAKKASAEYKIYVTNATSNNMSIINSGSTTPFNTINTGQSPRNIIYNKSNNKIYISHPDAGLISVINAASNTAEGTITVSGMPFSLALNSSGTKLYSSDFRPNGSISTINTQTNTEVSNLLNFIAPEGLVVSPDSSRLYVANTEANNNPGFISVIDTNNYSTIATIPTGIGSNSIDISPDGSRLLVTNDGGVNLGNTVSVIDTATNTIINTILVGINPHQVIYNSTGTKAYVMNTHYSAGPFPGSSNGSISVINTQTNTVTNTIPVGPVPGGIALSPDDNVLYVTIGGVNSSGNKVAIISTLTNTVVGEITVGTNPFGITTSPNSPSQNADLNVPVLKQTSKPWKTNKYDSANKWSPKDTSINSWGCALTSAAMVFKYHGINKLPNNKALDPGSLNNWLNNQKDGYVGTGWVNWIALSRLSKESTIINNITSFHALEFSRKNSSDIETVKEDLSNNLPDILGVPGHFIVATGIEDNVIKINDPAYDRTSLSDYGNTFNTISKFTPSHTDLSYIMLTSDPNLNLELKSENGDILGDSYIQESIITPFNPNQTNESLKIIYLQKPVETDFNIFISSSSEDKKYDLKLYLYDKDGKVFTKSYKGVLSPDETKTIPFIFNKSSTLYPKKVTYASTGIDIEKAWKQNLIIDKDIRNLLHETLVKALVQSAMKNDEDELNYLMKFENILNENNGTKILSPGYDTLLYDINYLSTHL